MKNEGNNFKLYCSFSPDPENLKILSLEYRIEFYFKTTYSTVNN